MSGHAYTRTLPNPIYVTVYSDDVSYPLPRDFAGMGVRVRTPLEGILHERVDLRVGNILLKNVLVIPNDATGHHLHLFMVALRWEDVYRVIEAREGGHEVEATPSEPVRYWSKRILAKLSRWLP